MRHKNHTKWQKQLQRRLRTHRKNKANTKGASGYKPQKILAFFNPNAINAIYKIYKNNSDQKRVKDTMIKEKFPLKFPKDKKEEDKIIELVEELQEIDDKNQIQKSENDLNDIIYELYDLNDNEIQVIEEYLEY